MNNLTLITGASSGIGLELAKVMASKGHNLILVARSKDKLVEIARGLTNQYGVKVIVHAFDLSQPRAGEALYESLRSHNNEITAIVNNAGVGEIKAFHEHNLSSLTEMIQLNLTSLTELCRLYAALFAARKNGRILNVASTAAYQPGPYMAAYYASKAYVLSLSEAIRYELSIYNVQVSVLCPGPTISGFQARSGMSEERMLRLKRIFSKAVMTSEDVAQITYDEWALNKAVIVPGRLNLVASWVARITPRWLTSIIVAGINRR